MQTTLDKAVSTIYNNNRLVTKKLILEQIPAKAFDDDNNLSLYVALWLASGSAYTAELGYILGFLLPMEIRAAGSSNFFDSTDNILFITGMQLEVGSVATEFEHRSFGEIGFVSEVFYPLSKFGVMRLQRCITHKACYIVRLLQFYTLNLPVPMRGQPTFVFLWNSRFYKR